MPKQPKVPIRADDQTTVTYSMSRELKAKIILLAQKEFRESSSWLRAVLTPIVEHQLAQKGMTVSENLIEKTLEESKGRRKRY